MLLSYLRKEMNFPTCGQLPPAEMAQAAPARGEERSALKLVADGKIITGVKLVLPDTTSKWPRLEYHWE